MSYGIRKQKGWTRNQPDCWLPKCSEPVGKILHVGWHEIGLCSGHRAELEEKSQFSYSTAAPPKGYRSHWPWVVASFLK